MSTVMPLVPAVGSLTTLGAQMSGALEVVAASQPLDNDSFLFAAPLAGDGTSLRENFAAAYSFTPPKANELRRGPNATDYERFFTREMRARFEVATSALMKNQPTHADFEKQDMADVNYPDLVRTGLLTFNTADVVVMRMLIVNDIQFRESTDWKANDNHYVTSVMNGLLMGGSIYAFTTIGEWPLWVRLTSGVVAGLAIFAGCFISGVNREFNNERARDAMAFRCILLNRHILEALKKARDEYDAAQQAAAAQ